MGADGGFTITKISILKKDWKLIRAKMIDLLRYDFDNLENLPKSIEKKTAQEIVEILSFAKHCDCPYLIANEYLIMPYGDNLPNMYDTINRILPCEYVETWS